MAAPGKCGSRRSCNKAGAPKKRGNPTLLPRRNCFTSLNTSIQHHTTLLMVLSNKQISNTFHFTFSVGSDALKNGLKIRNVVPSTEEEARRILERMDAEGLFD